MIITSTSDQLPTGKQPSSPLPHDAMYYKWSINQQKILENIPTIRFPRQKNAQELPSMYLHVFKQRFIEVYWSLRLTMYDIMEL